MWNSNNSRNTRFQRSQPILWAACSSYSWPTMKPKQPLNSAKRLSSRVRHLSRSLWRIYRRSPLCCRRIFSTLKILSRKIKENHCQASPPMIEPINHKLATRLTASVKTIERKMINHPPKIRVSSLNYSSFPWQSWMLCAKMGRSWTLSLSRNSFLLLTKVTYSSIGTLTTLFKTLREPTTKSLKICFSSRLIPLGPWWPPTSTSMSSC